MTERHRKNVREKQANRRRNSERDREKYKANIIQMELFSVRNRKRQ